MSRISILIVLATFATSVAAATTQPSARQLTPEAKAKAAEWLNVAAEAVANMPRGARPYYSHMILEVQARCDASADPDAIVEGVAAFKYEPPRPQALAYWYARIGHALGKHGHMKAFQRCMDLADDQAVLIDDPDDSYQARRAVLLTIKAVEGLDAAVAFIESIESPRWRAEFCCDIVTASIDPPTTQQSRQLINKAVAEAKDAGARADDPERVDANLAMAMIAIGQFDEAEPYIERLPSASWKAYLARDLALAAWKRGNDAKYQLGLKRFDANAPDTIDAAGRYAHFAEALYKVSPKSEWKEILDKAITLAEELGDREREYALRAVANTQISCERLDDASKTIKQLKETGWSDYLKARIAVAKSKAGDSKSAESALDDIRDSASRLYLLAELFRLESEAGRDEHLRELMNNLTADDERLRAACGVLASIWSTPGKDDSEVERKP